MYTVNKLYDAQRDGNDDDDDDDDDSQSSMRHLELCVKSFCKIMNHFMVLAFKIRCSFILC